MTSTFLNQQFLILIKTSSNYKLQMKIISLFIPKWDVLTVSDTLSPCILSSSFISENTRYRLLTSKF